ncbi:uncharacterized protein LOC135482855 [Lineus longissimus]|uniref:uncharacterized protein LOC135482855 n=1 Tax=Lineus longissimus TaxID=88925 RepID=UPI002B4CBD89
MAGEQETKNKVDYYQGWLEHRAGGSGGSKEKYNYLYIVLRKRKLHIYPRSEINSTNPIGSLSLDRFTTVKRKDKGGYKIELSTVSTQPADGTPVTFKHNTFKSTSKADRDLWYAFLAAFSQGTVPGNVTLHPSDKIMIEEALQDCIRPDNLPPPGIPGFEAPPPPRIFQRANTESDIWTNPPLHPKTDIHSPIDLPDCSPPPAPGEGTPKMRLRKTSTQSEILFNRPLPSVPRCSSQQFSGISSGSDDSSRRSSTGTTSHNEPDRTDGPFMFHRFYTNKGNCHNVPSWFFENCTRDSAEMILTLGKRYGNTMMRESTTYRQSGSYVIDTREETQRGSSIRHFEIIRVAEGFKIDLIDIKHEPMACLTEVMNFFTQSRGAGSDSRPMSTNDRSLIGLPEVEYDRVLNPYQASSPTARSPPDEEDIYTLPDNLRQGEGAEDSDQTGEKYYMEMGALTKSLSKSASIPRQRPSPNHQPPHQMGNP